MAAAANVSFDVLLGGKITPEALKALNDMEAKLKQFGATTRTVNAVMSRAYRETFDTATKEGHKAFEKLEHESKSAFHLMAEHAKEASEKIKESFERVTEFGKEMREKMFEFFGISGVIGGVAGAISVEELIKHGTEVYASREQARDTLAATLRGRGRGDLLPGYQEAIEKLAKEAPIGYEASADMLRKLAATGRFRGPEEAERMAKAIAAVSGGTKESTEGAFGAYEKMLLSGKLMPKALVGISKGSGFSILQQMARDAGMAVGDLSKALSAKKGGIAPAEAMQMLNKAILELGEGKALPLLEARLKGMQGLFYRLGEDWENFLEKIGEIWDNVISPIANEINAWLDSINWEQTFSALIEKSKEWGQTIRNVFDMVLNSAVAKRFQQMWEDFWNRMVGGEMYGPWVRAWDDAQKHIAGKWHWERQPTEAGRKWMENASQTIGTVLDKIADFVHFIFEHGDAIITTFQNLIIALLALEGIKTAATILSLTTALAGPQGLGVAILAVTGYFATLTKNMLDFLGTPEGKKMSSDMEKARMHPGATAADVVKSMEAGAGYSSPAARAAAQQGLEYAARTNDKAAEAALHRAEADEKLRALNEKVRQDQEKHNKAIQDATGALYGRSPGFIPAVTDATTELQKFIPAMEQAVNQLSSLSLMGPGGMGAGGISPTGAHETEYGPAVDPIGSKDFDWNSYKHIGAWPNITGPLRAGDAALGYGAQAFYHVMPGQYFTDPAGRVLRFADRSGSKDPMNIDIFKGAAGGIVTRPTASIIGEAGPEAVIPLRGAGAGLGMNLTVNFGSITLGGSEDPRSMFRQFAQDIAYEVQQAINAEHRRSAVV